MVQNIENTRQGIGIESGSNPHAPAATQNNFDEAKAGGCSHFGLRIAGRSRGGTSFGNFDRQEHPGFSDPPHTELATPPIHQRAINIVATRHLGHRGFRRKRLRNDLLPYRRRPASSPTSPCDDLHPVNGHVAILAACIVAKLTPRKTADYPLLNKAALGGSLP
jgi:hypothetical protein